MTTPGDDFLDGIDPVSAFRATYTVEVDAGTHSGRDWLNVLIGRFPYCVVGTLPRGSRFLVGCESTALRAQRLIDRAALRYGDR